MGVLPVSVDWRQWRTGVIPVLEDERWRTGLNSILKIDETLLTLMGGALRQSFEDAGWGPKS